MFLQFIELRNLRMLKSFVVIALSVYFTYAVAESQSSNSSACEDACYNVKEIYLVCGSDNVTYMNPGEITCLNKCRSQKLTVVQNKPCDCECPNTREFFLVCASDGHTYVNTGAVKCHNKCNFHKIKIVDMNPCNEEDEDGLPY